MAIAHLLNQSPNCLCKHEAIPRLVREATQYLYGKLDAQSLALILRLTRFQTVDGKVYGESNQKFTGMATVLAEEFPGSQFVWLTRDGRHVVTSTMARGWYKTLERTKSDYPGLSEVHLDWTRFRLDGSKTGDFSDDEWGALSRFEKCCWHWAKVNEIISRELADRESMRIALEQINDQINPLALWLGLTKPTGGFRISKCNSSSPGSLRRWTAWTKAERRIFDRRCGAMMNILYPDRYAHRICAGDSLF